MTKNLTNIKTFIPCCSQEFTDADKKIIIDVSKALGNQARLEIFTYLWQNNSCMTSQLVDYLPLAQSTISQHLKVLKDSGVIYGEIDGPSTNYCINKQLMNRYYKLIGMLV